MTLKNKVDVRIAGKDYTLMGIESDEYLHRVGLYIDKKMNEIMRTNGKLSTSMAAVLTAINVADDFFKSRENEVTLKKELKQAQDELEKLKEDNRRLAGENAGLNDKSIDLQLELAKREAEVGDVKSSYDTKAKVHNLQNRR